MKNASLMGKLPYAVWDNNGKTPLFYNLTCVFSSDALFSITYKSQLIENEEDWDLSKCDIKVLGIIIASQQTPPGVNGCKTPPV